MSGSTDTTTAHQGNFIVYEATDRKLKFMVGDILDCTPEAVGAFDRIWETNSLGALNPEDREKIC